MIPVFQGDGNLPPGIHWATWQEFSNRFGTTAWRRELLSGLREALLQLRSAGCQTAYVDGSFVSTEQSPGDYDCCWDTQGVDGRKLDPVLLTFDAGRALQKAKYFGELFPSMATANVNEDVFLDFFQVDKETGAAKGIVAIDLRGIL